jgi:deferrochelatase/peroxidase EfeB
VGAGVAALSLPFVLAGCPWRGDVARSSHPALTVPEAFGVVVMLDLAESQDALGTLRTLVRLVDDPPTGASVTIALGGSLFARLGKERLTPRGLSVMESFPGDVLRAERTGGDLLVQVGSDDAAVAARVADGLESVEGLVTRWRVPVSRPENTVTSGRALMRNGFGFVEGHGNAEMSRAADPDEGILIGSAGEQGWVAGGSFMAVRVIQLATRLWDADPVVEQERIIGRRRDGGWLDGSEAFEEPDFAGDPEGVITPLASHVRRANPRDGSFEPRMLRRSWNYSMDLPSGGVEDGLVFMSFQADLGAGFAGVQRRLAGQDLDRYLLTTGGGYYFVPPSPDRATEHWLDVLGE